MTHKEYLENVDTLNRYAKHYYELDNPIASDEEYDRLYQEICEYEKSYPQNISPHSPTQRVENAPLENFIKKEHKTRMWSLEDVFNQHDLQDWLQKLDNAITRNATQSHQDSKQHPTNNLAFCISPKYDGMSLNLIYKHGQLQQAITRGDGIQGEVVTQNAKVIESIPQNITFLGEIEVRGEVVMSKDNFNKLNNQREIENKSLFANPRNAAAGSMRQLDSALVRERELDFIPWGIGYYDEQELRLFLSCNKESSNMNTLGFYDLLQLLPQMGFTKHRYLQQVQAQDIESAYQEILAKRENFPFLLDGFVIVVDDLILQRELGFTQKAPRFACAYKFPAHETTIQIESISWQVGRTGVITPVANFTPTSLEGAMISRATLHNFKEIERSDIRIGDHCLLIRSGDVIPKITKVFKERRNGNETIIPKPSQCPACEHTLHFEDIFIYCQNPKCLAKLKASLTHFTSKKAFDIAGLGESIIELLVDYKLIAGVVDIYFLQKESLLQLPNFKEKRAQNLLNAIRDSINHRELWRFIHALGILHIGEVASKKLAQFGTECFTMPKEQVANIDGFGEELAQSFTLYCQNNKEFIEQLLSITKPQISNNKKPQKADSLLFATELAVSQEKSQMQQTFAYLIGKTCVITGTFAVNRDFLKNRLEELGAHVSSNISTKTNFLLAGEKSGSKLAKAKKFNITILTQEDIKELIQFP
ncbi:NAD-dependent DNA ligase LigA [Helicobacter aurati]|uniref:DNA ligase n=1 Tax=Helicobacter aurati TaxID=137778 RepID=A0A3D8J0L9_9HELI|nr:NAD-dependent DNA ligase LigA [Helicobacter aurati]RDU70321.1 NAD-dependent DNA ligase LigA [Helicobacter aurati]